LTSNGLEDPRVRVTCVRQSRRMRMMMMRSNDPVVLKKRPCMLGVWTVRSVLLLE
jgi:hypothetical protein